jgi:hypothetical protein
MRPKHIALPSDRTPGAAEAAPARPRREALRALGSTGLLVAGCGGTELAGVGSGGTGQVASSSYASGTITGFGSVIVNGIRYDDTAAAVTDEFGATRTLPELALGMVVEIQGTVDESAGTGVAATIRVLSELRGPITAIERPAGRLVVLGTTVQSSAATVWPDATGVSSLGVGQQVEVWGYPDREAGVLRATRIEPISAAARPFVVRGPVADLDRSAGTLRVGAQRVDLRRASPGPSQAAVASVLASLVDGATVVVAASTPPAAAALAWLVERIVVIAPAQALQTVVARIDGRVAALGAGPRFEVAGVPVDAGAAEFRGGAASMLRVGLRVRVLGVASGGRVTARTVELRDDGSDAKEDENEVRGTVERLGADPRDFTLRDAAGRLFVVAASQAQLIDGLRLNDLRVGVRLQVRGRGAAPLIASWVRIDR